MLNIFSKYQGLKPAEGATMLRVPGDYQASVELDVTDLNQAARTQLIRDLKAQGLNTEIRENTLQVSGQVVFQYSRGSDAEGRKAIWLSAEGPVVEIMAQILSYVYTSKGWNLSSGRVMREVIAKVGGEVRLPDGAVIYVGESEDYQASLVSSDGAFVHPKLTPEQRAILGINATSDDVDEDEDPFK